MADTDRGRDDTGGQPTQPEAGRRGALGRGLSSLLGDDLKAVIGTGPLASSGRAGSPTLHYLSPAEIEPNPQQPRKIFDQESIEQLADSLKRDGIVQPVVVTKIPGRQKFTLVSGERRWRAAQMAGMESVPAVIRENVSHDLLRLALVENIQRKDLNVIEEALGYAALIEDFGFTQEQCANVVGKDRSTIANLLRLLTLPQDVQDDVIQGKLSMAHARTLLGLHDRALIKRARDIVVAKELSVRHTEQLCKTLVDKGRNEDKSGDRKRLGSADLDYIAERLRGSLKTKVRLRGSGARGKIEISYFSAAELERIVSMMSEDSFHT